MNTNRISTMGVINITPDSFSDGNQFNSSESFGLKFNRACSDFDILDLGAESTAPFNDPISSADELKRFERIFYPLLTHTEDNSLTISIDTYKVEVFCSLYDAIKKYWPSTHIIFNDVSGKIDEELITLLSSERDFSYIFSHNLAPNRSKTNEHMQYVTQEDIVLHMKQFFQQAIGTLKNFNKKILLDPCFGFSKTRQQNHTILKNIATIFDGIETTYDLVFGISRKSFLRFPHNMDVKNRENQKELDALQALLFKDLLEQIPNRNIILRVHDLHSLQAVKNYYQIIS